MSEQTYEWIEYKLADGVATITFNAPRFNNALGLKGLQEFLDALHRAEADDAVGAVVVTGRGKAFCAGFNLKEMPVKDLDIEKIAAHFRVLAMWWHQILHLFTRMPKPILAAVNGVAAGSGLGMTLCADMAVCKDTASFFPAWHTIGIANDATTSYSLAKIVGFRHAMEWMMTNRTINANEALEWNVVNRVYDEANFDKQCGRNRARARCRADPPAGNCQGRLPHGLEAIDRGGDRIRDPERHENDSPSALSQDPREVPVRRAEEQPAAGDAARLTEGSAAEADHEDGV